MTAWPTNPEVIVIGAGAAGLSAAQTLRRAGIETLVLEAAGHIGGRCVTDQTTFSTPFDLGGSWLHSAPINPLARRAEQAGMTLHKQDWDHAWVHASGKNLSPDDVEDVSEFEVEMWEAVNRAGAEAADCTIKSAIPNGPWSSTAAHLIAQMLSVDADAASAKDTFNYAQEDGDWLVEGGLGAFVAELHKDVPVKLNCPVTKIDYAGGDVELTTPHGILRAAHVIMTVSTAVLAAEKITFNPPLPLAKTKAVEQLPCGLLNKVGIEFDPAWAQATQGQMASYHSSEAEFCSILFGFYDTSLATGFVAGRFADALEGQGAGAATAYCLEGLRAIFGSDISKHILRTKETAWRGNATTLGAYSYAKPGATDARRTLAEPLADRVFFGGEATMPDTYSTVHGAYLSGQRAADEVIATRSLTPFDRHETATS